MKQERLTTDSLIGSVLLGRYRIVRELAKGGMGVVYLARAEGAVGFVKPVVVKLVLPEHAEDERFVGMFAREARILAQLRHPSVVNVLEFGVEDDAYVLVLEYVRGHHLGQWLRFLHLKGRSAPPEILIQVVIDVLEALHHAHNQRHPDGSPMQIVHRDVSPSNILLDEDGRGRLLDFGVARMRGGAHDYKTQVKGFMGKLPYTAPEIFGGQEATPQSDLYACAVVLHEVLFGRNVFRTESQAATLHTVMTHVPEAIEPLRPVPKGFDAVLGKALAKNPLERFFSAREFAAALRKLQTEQESEVRARLAALLKDDFGPELADMLKIESLAERDEAWRRLSLRPPESGTAEPSPAERSAARARRNTRDDLRSGSGLSPGGLVAPPAIDATVASPRRGAQASAGAAASTTPEHGEQPALKLPPAVAASPTAAATGTQAAPNSTARDSRSRRAPSNQRVLLVALGVTAALAVVAIVLSLQARSSSGPEAGPSIRVVELPSEPPREVGQLPERVANEPFPEAVAAVPEAPSEAVGEEEPGRPGAAVARKRGPDPRDLTRAFRRQQPKIEACFREHASGVQGQPRMQLELDLDESGRVEHVQIAPEALGATPLGKCLVQVARQTPFPSQGQAVSFSIPVMASTGGG